MAFDRTRPRGVTPTPQEVPLPNFQQQLDELDQQKANASTVGGLSTKVDAIEKDISG